MQRSLFDPDDLGDPPAPHNGTETSKVAAAKAKVRSHRARVLEALEAGEKTCEELEGWTGLAHQTVSAAVRALCQRGDIINTGRSKPTNLSGRQARIYALKEKS